MNNRIRNQTRKNIIIKYLYLIIIFFCVKMKNTGLIETIEKIPLLWYKYICRILRKRRKNEKYKRL